MLYYTGRAVGGGEQNCLILGINRKKTQNQSREVIFSNNKRKTFSSELSGGRPSSKLHKEVSFGPIPFYLYLFIFPLKKYLFGCIGS